MTECTSYNPDYQAQGDCINCGHPWERHTMEHQTPQNIQDLIDIAHTYFKDGAFHTAADRLEKAAEEIRKLAAQRGY